VCKRLRFKKPTRRVHLLRITPREIKARRDMLKVIPLGPAASAHWCLCDGISRPAQSTGSSSRQREEGRQEPA
jgi:hypothetical protein